MSCSLKTKTIYPNLKFTKFNGKNFSHDHFIFSILKIIRVYFLFDRKLLSELSRAEWDILGLYYKNSVNKEMVMAAAATCLQTFGDFLGFNPHPHILASDGCFGEDGVFYASPVKINTEEPECLYLDMRYFRC